MAINVICPGCKARFKVGDEHAGKKGPCPKCKAEITIPEKKEEVVIHAPEHSEAGARDSKGRHVLKPIKRDANQISKPLLGACLGIVAAMFLAALIAGNSWRDDSQAAGESTPATERSQPPRGNPFLLALGALIVAPPLAVIAYAFLRDSELEPYRGLSLWIRVGACSAAYVAVWGGYAIVKSILFPADPPDLFAMTFIAPVMVVTGAVAALACFDFEFGTAAVHYGFYLAVTVLLRLTAGLTVF